MVAVVDVVVVVAVVELGFDNITNMVEGVFVCVCVCVCLCVCGVSVSVSVCVCVSAFLVTLGRFFFILAVS